MTAWRNVELAEPEFAGRVRRLFDGGRHKTIATLRADGSPRISGIECEFADGELRFGSMPNARKGADLGRDPRFALHGPPIHPQEGQEASWPGEAKIAGRAVPADSTSHAPAGRESAGRGSASREPGSDGSAAGEPDGGVYVADISEVVITHLNPEATMLVVESWTPQRGLRVVQRE